jgi:DNA-binding IclR family transcriptional regulator
MQAHKGYLSFSALRAACLLRGLTATLQVFEGGETVTIKQVDSGKQLLRITREYGQTENAAAAAAQWLYENDYIVPGDTTE